MLVLTARVKLILHDQGKPTVRRLTVLAVLDVQGEANRTSGLRAPGSNVHQTQDREGPGATQARIVVFDYLGMETSSESHVQGVCNMLDTRWVPCSDCDGDGGAIGVAPKGRKI